MVLRWRRISFRGRDVASDSRNGWVCFPPFFPFSIYFDDRALFPLRTDGARLTLSRRSPAELDELFQSKVKPWRFHKTETATQRLVRIQGEQ